MPREETAVRIVLSALWILALSTIRTIAFSRLCFLTR